MIRGTKLLTPHTFCSTAVPAILTILLYPNPASLPNVSREISLYAIPRARVALSILKIVAFEESIDQQSIEWIAIELRS